MHVCVLFVRMVTALHIASEKGQAGIVELLTKHGAKVNERDHLGRTPLHVAAQNGRVGVARFLRANGADQNIKTASGQDVEAVSVHLLLEYKDVLMMYKQVATQAVVKLLQEKQPACSNSDIESQLLEAAKNGDIDVVKVHLHIHHALLSLSLTHTCTFSFLFP